MAFNKNKKLSRGNKKSFSTTQFASGVRSNRKDNNVTSSVPRGGNGNGGGNGGGRLDVCTCMRDDSGDTQGIHVDNNYYTYGSMYNGYRVSTTAPNPRMQMNTPTVVCTTYGDGSGNCPGNTNACNGPCNGRLSFYESNAAQTLRPAEQVFSSGTGGGSMSASSYRRGGRVRRNRPVRSNPRRRR